MLTRLGADSEQVAQAAVDALKVMVSNALGIVATLAVMFWTSWRVSLVLLLLAPALAWMMGKVGKRYRRLNHAIQESAADMLQTADQALHAQQDVKAYGAQPAEMARYGMQTLRNLRLALKIEVTRGTLSMLVQGLGVRYVLVGDDFRFGAKRAGDYGMLDAAGDALGFDVARMNSYEVHGLRVSSSAVREALGGGRMDDVARLLGHPYCISGHVVHGRKLGRELGFRTLNLRFAHWKPAASGIFAVLVHGLTDGPLQGVANLGVRPSLDPNDVNGGRVLLETHCLDWPVGLAGGEAYGKIVRVELLHKLHDELRYDGLDALKRGIAKDCDDARVFFASLHGQTHRQVTRDRI